MRKRKTIKEVPVRNNPGIYKRYEFDSFSGTWVHTGKYRAIRRNVVDGASEKEQAVFDSIEDAKSFRAGTVQKPVSAGITIHQRRPDSPHEGLTFGALVDQWKPFHFLKLEQSTRQTYEKRLPNLGFLKDVAVERITTSVIDQLVSFWVTGYPKDGKRFTFEKELNLLKVILNFYRKRVNPAYPMPVLGEHYQAADIAKRAAPPVQSLSQEELGKFLEDLKNSKSPIFFSMALTQFCLGLRIGELCGMNWDAIDLESRVARIEWTVMWDHTTWEPTIKHRPKNGKVRILVIPEILVHELKRLKALRDPKVPLVFHSHGRPMNRQTVAKAYNRAIERLGIKHIRGTHMIRKTSATLANEATGDFYAVSKLMDHSSPNVTLRYVAQTSAQKRKVADALNGVLVKQNGLEKAKEHSAESSGFDENTRTHGDPVPSRPRREIAGKLKLVISNS